jgi:hypothetical protein
MSISSLLDEDLEAPIYISDIVQPDNITEPDIVAQPDAAAQSDITSQSVFIAQSNTVDDRKCHRLTSPQARRAQKKLGHVLEYLNDEFVFEGGPFYSSDARIDAIQIVKELLRQICFESAVEPTFGERVKASFLRLMGRPSIH